MFVACACTFIFVSVYFSVVHEFENRPMRSTQFVLFILRNSIRLNKPILKLPMICQLSKEKRMIKTNGANSKYEINYMWNSVRAQKNKTNLNHKMQTKEGIFRWQHLRAISATTGWGVFVYYSPSFNCLFTLNKTFISILPLMHIQRNWMQNTCLCHVLWLLVHRSVLLFVRPRIVLHKKIAEENKEICEQKSINTFQFLGKMCTQLNNCICHTQSKS